MTRLWRAFRGHVAFCLYEAPAEPIELWTAINAFIWGAWLANPWMDVFTGSYYLGMARLPESVWGTFAMCAAVAQLAGRLTGRAWLIRIGAKGIAALWMFGAGALAMQNWRFAANITYPMMAALSVFVSYRAAYVLRPSREVPDGGRA